MVKGISRRVVVVDSPDQRYFEQAIFIVRNDAAGEGVTAQALVEEARRVARNYAGGDHGRFSHAWRELTPAVYTLIGAGGIGLIWLLAAAGQQQRCHSQYCPNSFHIDHLSVIIRKSHRAFHFFL